MLGLMEFKRKDVWSLLLVLLLGQLVAFSMAASSFTSSLIANLGTRSFILFTGLIHRHRIDEILDNCYLDMDNMCSLPCKMSV